MRGETELHRSLKQEACRWLYRSGYQCIAAEVRLNPLGIIDAVGTGNLGPDGHCVCFIECKASRSDFLRDQTHDGQMQLCLMERKANLKFKRQRSALKQRVGLGKFAACLLQPMANLHYLLAPAEMIRKVDVPPRWGLLSLGAGGVSVIVKAPWQECDRCGYVESAIARTLTADIYRADNRAMMSVNREIIAQQRNLAEKIRALTQQIVLADSTPPARVESGSSAR